LAHVYRKFKKIPVSFCFSALLWNISWRITVKQHK